MKRWLCVAAILLLAAGCTGGGKMARSAPPAGAPPAAQPAQPEAKPEAKPEAQPAGVQGDCPAGLFQVSADDPKGRATWCHKKAADGTLVKEGSYKRWYTNGKPEAVGQYAAGLQTGMWEEYGPTGNKSEGPYAKGKRDGTWTIRHENGMREVGAFKDGERTGEWTMYWNDKDVRKEAGPYVAGNRDGVWTYFDQNNLKTGEATYKAGQLVSTRQVKREEKPAAEAPAKVAAPKAAAAKAPAAEEKD